MPLTSNTPDQIIAVAREQAGAQIARLRELAAMPANKRNALLAYNTAMPLLHYWSNPLPEQRTGLAHLAATALALESSVTQANKTRYHQALTTALHVVG
jgi:hypothetical protein